MRKHIYVGDAGRDKFKGMDEFGNKIEFYSYVTKYKKPRHVNYKPGDYIMEWVYVAPSGKRIDKGKWHVGYVVKRLNPQATKNTEEYKGHEKTVILNLVGFHQLGAQGMIKVGNSVPLDTFDQDLETLTDLYHGTHIVTVTSFDERGRATTYTRELIINRENFFCMPEGYSTYYGLPEELVYGKVVHVFNIGSTKSHAINRGL
jgi:hypothetical protein